VGISDGASDSPERVKVAGFPDGFLKARLDNISKNGGTPGIYILPSIDILPSKPLPNL
jgi:hypothetical protein